MNVRELKPFTKLLNNPREYLDTHFKLIFVYPLLYTNGAGIQPNLVRDFIARYYLKELIISNSLQLLTRVPSVEVPDKAQQIVNTITQQPVTSQNFLFNSKYDYQEAVNLITSTFRKYLETDPLYSKFRPVLHTIVIPDNLITIPVIVGSKMLPMDKLAMTCFLIIAIVNNLTLDRSTNLDKIVDIIKDLSSKGLVDSKASSFNKLLTSILRSFEKGKSSLPIKTRPLFRSTNQQRSVSEDEFIIRDLFTGFDQFCVHWRMVLDSRLFHRKFGLPINPQDQLGKHVISSVDRRLNRIVENTLYDFQSELNTRISDLEITIFNFFQPVASQNDLSRIISNLNNNILSYFVEKANDSIIQEVSKAISDLGKDVTSLVVIGEKLLDKIRKEQEQFTKKYDNAFQYKLTSNTPDDYQYAVNNIVPHFDSYLTYIEGLKSELEQLISSNLSGPLADYFNNNLHSVIRRYVLDAIRSVYGTETTGYVAFLKTSGITSISNSELTDILAPIVYQTIYVTYLLHFVNHLAEFLYRSEVEFKVATSEVTDFPNYTLVLPLDILEIIHSFMYVRDFNKLLKTGDFRHILRIQSLSTRYLKDVIQYLCDKLRIPSIIAFDDKTNKVYYRFMNQSEVNNVNVMSIENFVKSFDIY